MESDQKGPINLGNPHEITIMELATTIIRLAGSTSTLVCMASPNDDPKRRKPDIALAKEHLKWEPTVELEAGLMQTIEYFRGLDMRFYRKPTPHTAHQSSEMDQAL
ncbi:dTDP-glucose 4,6-dehydratase [Saprolegnia diclina VS20]|uniref:dTDP-glucose 4,6-dehydratase n=1 Tax=Saprolegnia diclina (strain VS20) TaxID=1156394 RepID=T0S8A3_SAPDV|nr:dTDP-glucose 4,6-dehydratase [Saprolegnia diclina VS20]EQC41458.1 dTDP-glucose 4,6-dehydratase [Saprolegnia diclina VS20]|eukprot:XP_008605172.1 dTDP-glucose 4,6-dehydratase [Saprolegnia diclina VS20]